MRRAAVLAAGLALAACVDYFAWDSSTGVVVIGWVGDGAVIEVIIEAPDTVSAGSAFDVTVNTFGSSSCTRPERLDVEVTGQVARLTPYDLVPTGDVECTADFGAHPHQAEVMFPTAGHATLEVLGRAASGDTIVRKAVVVR